MRRLRELADMYNSGSTTLSAALRLCSRWPRMEVIAHGQNHVIRAHHDAAMSLMQPSCGQCLQL
eukprot:258146-Karenia_brevis.AAC.1